jgi:hypothetical protein
LCSSTALPAWQPLRTQVLETPWLLSPRRWMSVKSLPWHVDAVHVVVAVLPGAWQAAQPVREWIDVTVPASWHCAAVHVRAGATCAAAAPVCFTSGSSVWQLEQVVDAVAFGP